MINDNENEAENEKQIIQIHGHFQALLATTVFLNKIELKEKADGIVWREGAL